MFLMKQDTPESLLPSFPLFLKKFPPLLINPYFSPKLIHIYLVKSLMKLNTLCVAYLRQSTHTVTVKTKLTPTTITQTYIYCFLSFSISLESFPHFITFYILH